MRRGILLAGCGVGLGAGLMYVFDPERGKRRRALIHDRATHVVGAARVALDRKAHDIGNRARGLVAETGAALRCKTVSDDVLAERVRSQIGRAVSRPRDVEALANEGRVTLRGVVRAGEVGRLLRRVAGVRGVRSVESQLNVKGRHGGEQEDGSANGKGAVARTRRSLSLPSRLLSTFAGSGLALYGARRRGVVGSVVSIIGMRMLTRGLGNKRLHQGNGASENGDIACVD